MSMNNYIFKTSFLNKHFMLFRTFVLLLGVFLLLVINREFGVADNGDFSRYSREFISKPVALKVNSPPEKTDEWNYRFFSQPIFLWSHQENTPDNKPWFTSARIFWDTGISLGKNVFSQNIINLRYAGILFFLVHCAVFFLLIFSIRSKSIKNLLVFLVLLFVYTDARITAFYNSFYAESVPLLALTATFSYFMIGVMRDEQGKAHEKYTNLILSVVCLALIILAVFAKRQYLYFLIPATLFLAFFISYLLPNFSWVKKVLLFFIATGLLLYIAADQTVSNRIKNQEELNASRITSYHAIYYGILPLSNKKNELLNEIGLPQDSFIYIGKNAWNDSSLKFISENISSLDIKVYLNAIQFDPLAFIKLALSNAKEVGNFDIPLGMVPGDSLQYPPRIITLATVVTTHFSGVIFCGFVFLSGFLLIFCRFGVNSEAFYFSRTSAAILLSIFILDILISTFDGQQEARKHVLIASFSGMLITVQLINLSFRALFSQSPILSHLTTAERATPKV